MCYLIFNVEYKKIYFKIFILLINKVSEHFPLK